MAEAGPTRTPGEVGVISAVLMTAVAGYIDAFLFLRHQVFGFAQSGNVIFLAVHVVTGGNWLQYVWPLLAYLAGLTCAQLMRTRDPGLPTRMIAATLAFQLAVFAALALLRRDAPAAVFVVALSFVGGIRLELFRAAGGISFVSIATTGNLMRFVQAIGDAVRDRSSESARRVALTAIVVAAFVGGALFGAAMTQHVGPALWGAVVLEGLSAAAYLRYVRGDATPAAA